jgi:hypothetical protein
MRAFLPLFLRLARVGGVLALLAAAGPDLPAQTGADFATLRARARAALNGGDALNATDPIYAAKIATLNNDAQNDWNNLIKTAGRTRLWNDLTISPTASDTVTPHFTRLKFMAAAYATPGAALHRNAALRDDILSALEWLNANHYAAGRTPYGNWFPWHLAVPLNVVDIFACLHDGITDLTRREALYSAYAAAISHYQNGPSRTYPSSGANLVWQAKIDILLGAATESSSLISLGRDRLSARAGVGNEKNVFAFVTSGDGFYTDGSFIQHNIHAYTGGYGLYLLNELAVVLEVLAGTPWTITDPGLENVYAWVENAFDPVMFRGGIMTHTQGREVARSGSTEHGYGHVALAAMARVARFAPPAEATRFRALIKQHLQDDAVRNFLNTATLSAAALVKPILDDAAIAPRAPRTGLFIFAGMDRVVAQRSSWAYAISMSSKRIAKYECINGENLRGWYLGDGAAYVYNGDLAQHMEGYWPTVDPSRLNGTTIDNRPRTNAGTSSPNTIDPRTTKAWVGGSSVLGLYGAAGMDHEGAQTDLRSKLSWFFFDDEVVHLGAGVTTSASNPHRVESVVMNRMIGHAGYVTSGANGATLTANGTARAATLNSTEQLAGITHAHLAAPLQSAFGTGDIGYYFPTPGTLQARREARTASWSLINTGGSTTQFTRHFLSLWFDHGVNPAAPGATFAYAVLPNKSAADTAGYAQNPDIEILANTTTVQAVREKRLSLIGANFWNASPAAPATVAGITADRPASVTVLTRDGRIHLGVSDPTQELAASAPLILELPYSAAALELDPRMSVLSLSPVRIAIALSGTRGRTLNASFQLAPMSAAPDVVTTRPDTPVRIAVLANDFTTLGTPLTITSTSFSPPAVVAAAPHGAVINQAATAAVFPVSVLNRVAAGASAPAALAALPNFTVLTGWRDAARGFAPKGTQTGITNFQVRSDATRTALRFQLETNTTSNPSAGGPTINDALSGSPGDALYVGAIGGGFTHLALTLGSYALATQDPAALDFRPLDPATVRPYAARAVGFILAGVGTGMTFIAEFRGVRGQLLATQTATAALAGEKIFYGLDAGPTPQHWIHSVVIRGNNNNANLGLDDVGFTPITAIDPGTLAPDGEALLYTPPPGFTGSLGFAYTVTDGVNTASAPVTVNIFNTPATIVAATASAYQDPNTPDKVLDGIIDAGTSRWSAEGDGQWIQLELARREKIGALNLSVYQGDTRRNGFEVLTSEDGAQWLEVFRGASSGTTAGLERIDLSPSWGRFVRLVGHGYTRTDGQAGALWNSFGEIEVLPTPNLPPVAPALTRDLRPGASVEIALLPAAGDPDAGPDTLTVTGLTTPAKGRADLVDGVAVYTAPAGFRGRDAFDYTVSDGAGTATARITLAIGLPASAQEFTTLYFNRAEQDDPAIGGHDADPDRDGVPNLLEYAWSRDPRSSDAAFPQISSPVAAGVARLALTFPRSRHATDLIYRVEASTDLVNWTPLAEATGTSDWLNLGAQAVDQTVADEATWRVVVTDAGLLGGATPRFLRLRVAHSVSP